MGEQTAISWTDHTFSPWWGCARVSPGCDHCYAEKLAHRYGHEVWTKDGPRRLLSDNHWKQPLKWDSDAERLGAPALVFCASMCDVFESHPELHPQRMRLWDLIEATPHLIWQLLTKRPQNVTAMVPRAWLAPRSIVTAGPTVHQGVGWPPNVWVGTSVEDQLRARIRIPRLLEVPAPVRFLSCEPLLAPVNLAPWLELDGPQRIGWVIVGGESGPGHRPMNPDDARRLRDQCEDMGIPFLFKQSSGPRPGQPGPPDLYGLRAFPLEARRAHS